MRSRITQTEGESRPVDASFYKALYPFRRNHFNYKPISNPFTLWVNRITINRLIRAGAKHAMCLMICDESPHSRAPHNKPVWQPDRLAEAPRPRRSRLNSLAKSSRSRVGCVVILSSSIATSHSRNNAIQRTNTPSTEHITGRKSLRT